MRCFWKCLREIAQRMDVTLVTIYCILGEEGLRPNPTPEAAQARERRPLTSSSWCAPAEGERLTDITPQEYDQALLALAQLLGRFPEMRLWAWCAPQFTRLLAEQNTP